MTEPIPSEHLDLVRGMIRYIRKPITFVEHVLDANPDEWQAEMLQALADHPRIAVRAGHGVGKTTAESWALLYFLFTRPFPKVPCTAPTKQQLHDVLWAEAAKWIERAPVLKKYFEWQKTRIVQREYPERWFATARTSNKPENLAGFHEEHILFIVDEASGVADEIFETIEGALTTKGAKLLICGNPTKTSGVFYDAFHKDRGLYWTRKVAVSDSKRVDPEYRKRLVKKYGEDSDVVRVRADGEFPKAEPDTFIPLESAEAATMREVDIPSVAPLEIGVDVARFGDDETVLAVRLGAKLIRLTANAKQDTMVTAGQAFALAKELMSEHDKRYCTIKVDDDGVGGGVVDRLREIVCEEDLEDRITIIDCHNGGKAKDEDHYDDWGTEAWAHLRDLLKGEDGEEIELIDDEDLIGQLTTRKYKITSKGRIKLERKEDMKKRGLRSPDRADAVVLAFAETQTITIDQLGSGGHSRAKGVNEW